MIIGVMHTLLQNIVLDSQARSVQHSEVTVHKIQNHSISAYYCYKGKHQFNFQSFFKEILLIYFSYMDICILVKTTI